ncbi:MAG: universal stress protein [Chloroflexota bacterium]|nr:universal stress protein [Chloroflexota bacterium]MDE3192304.1 universal stress protein [Chloroflexota bacterium]
MRILFATDGSATADVALDMLLALPLRASDHVTVLAVPVHSYTGVGIDGTGMYFAEIAEEETAAARRLASTVREKVGAKGVPTKARIDEGSVAQTIIEVARSEGAGVIVMGSRGLGRIAALVLGSTARAVSRHSPIPVLVARERREAPRRILVAADGSDDAYVAVRTLAALPLPKHLEVTLLHVLPERATPTAHGDASAEQLQATVERCDREDALDILSRAGKLLPEGVQVRMELERGRPAERILEVAAGSGSDLVVIGARGRSLRGEGFLQGSTTDELLENAHCAVLVARAPERVSAKARPRREGVPAGVA